MEYITVKEAAEKWGVTPRRVQILCHGERIKGAYRFGRSWMIPSRAVLPNARKKIEEPTLPMPKKSPFLDMTNLYNIPGGADECVEMLINNPEAHALFEAEIAYRRAQINKVYDKARYFLSSHSGFYAMIGGGMLLAFCAMWRGDIELWNEAKKHIIDAPHKTEEERELISLSLAIIDSSVYDNKSYPVWFSIGNFEALPPDSHPAAKVFYVKYLYMAAHGIATKQLKLEGVEGLALMRIIPNAIEPLITQAVVDKTVLPEILLRMSCAVAYHNSGMKEQAIAHIDKAVAMALKDKLYGTLTEYVRHFNGLLEDRIALVDPSALEIIRALYASYSIGWSALSGKIRNRFIATNLTEREREVAKLTAFGFKTHEIAGMLYLSESTIKQTVTRVLNKTGLVEKKDLYLIL